MRSFTHLPHYATVSPMSSKSAAARGSKRLLFEVLSLIETGRFSTLPYRKLQSLERYSYVTHVDSEYILTHKGKKTLNENKIWSLAIPTPKVWDGKWRMVLFDIPVDKRKRRDAFRLRLKELGLTLYQNSVWAYPYPLEDTIAPIAHFYGLSKCVSFIVAEKISKEASFRKRYRL